MKKIHVLLIDINAIGYSAMYQPNLAKLKDSNGQSTSAIHGAISSVLAAVRRHNQAVPFILWDGRPNWRFEILDAYKAHRILNKDGEIDETKVAIKEDYSRQSKIISLLLSDFGIPQIKCPSSEADDIAGLLCKHLNDTVKITLLTPDTDWLQAVTEEVSWESPKLPGKIISLKDFSDPEVDEKGKPLAPFKDGPFESPAEYILCKAVAGDSSDGIDGIEGVGIKTAKKIKDKYNGFETLFQMAEQGKLPKSAKEAAIAQGKNLIERNIKLMDWIFSPPLSEYTTLFSMRIDSSELYDQYQLNSLKKSRRDFNIASENFYEAIKIVDRALCLASMPSEFE